MSPEVKIHKIFGPRGDTLNSHLKALYNSFQGLDLGSAVSFDLRDLSWAPPFLIGPLAALICGDRSKRYHILPQSLSVSTYLQTVSFPYGVSSPQLIHSANSFIPICTVRQADIMGRNALETAFQEKLFNRCGIHPGAKSAFFLPISELTTNLIEHSNSSQGYLVGQHYPSKGYLDLAIVDTGQGMAGSYASGLGQALTHDAAILQALSGVSSKEINERGFGIQTSVRAVCKKMKGEFLIVSGDSAVYVSNLRNEKLDYTIIALPGFNWGGVIVLMRIPNVEEAIAISDIA